MSPHRATPTARPALRLAGAVVALAVPLAAGCGVGKNNETDRERSTPYTGSADSGALAVRAMRLVVDASASDASGNLASYVTMAIVNRGTRPDALTSATISGQGLTGATVQPTSTATSLQLPPRQVTQFGDPADAGAGTMLKVNGGTTPVIGTIATVTLSFQSGGVVRVPAPVVAALSFGGTATAIPVPLTGTYPSASPPPEGELTPRPQPHSQPSPA